MRHKLLALILPLAAIVGCAKTGDSTDYTRFVNTKIGSGGHGHVFVGANVPFGLVQLVLQAFLRHGTGAQDIMTATPQS